jgi:hypothetical protein
MKTEFLILTVGMVLLIQHAKTDLMLYIGVGIAAACAIGYYITPRKGN